MTNDLKKLKQLLINRLEQKGIERSLIPGFLRLLVNSLKNYSSMNLDFANERLHYLGWKDFQLDEHTYQLMIACFEDEQLDTFKSMPTEWFENEFSLETNK